MLSPPRSTAVAMKLVDNRLFGSISDFIQFEINKPAFETTFSDPCQRKIFIG